jgi:hypothetical protein
VKVSTAQNSDFEHVYLPLSLSNMVSLNVKYRKTCHPASTLIE